MQFFKPLRLLRVISLLTVLLVYCILMRCVHGDTASKPDLIEGDIVLDETTAFAIVNYKSGTSSRRKRETVRGNIRVWNEAVIPYVISENIELIGRKMIRKAFRQFARRTCIKFIPKQSRHGDYVKFIASNGCYSSVGRKGGEQKISLGKGCTDRGSAIHEIMHTVGFFHEHSRFDRDKYVKVLWWNIQEGMERNFISYSHETTDSLNEPYDYSSVMHYNNKAFTRNGADTMQSKMNPILRFGKRRALSTVDIRQLTKLYSCPGRKNKKTGLCRNKYRKCRKYATQSDLCESGYEFMKIFCAKACAFC